MLYFHVLFTIQGNLNYDIIFGQAIMNLTLPHEVNGSLVASSSKFWLNSTVVNSFLRSTACHRSPFGGALFLSGAVSFWECFVGWYAPFGEDSPIWLGYACVYVCHAIYIYICIYKHTYVNKYNTSMYIFIMLQIHIYIYDIYVFLICILDCIYTHYILIFSLDDSATTYR